MSNAQKQPQDTFYKKSVLKSFEMFPEKYLCRSLFLNKVAGLSSKAINFIKKRYTNTGVFLSILQNSEEHYFEEHLRKAASE